MKAVFVAVCFGSLVPLPSVVGQAVPSTTFAFFEPVRPHRQIQVIAHRGAMRRAPESSAAALELSIADSVEWIEVDVRLTKDRRHILFHDDVVDRKTNGTGPVRALTLSEISALDLGATFARRFAGTRVL